MQRLGKNMSDQDLDPSLVRTVDNSKEVQEYQMKYICDETTYMMFDLERGGFINYHGDTVEIDDLFKFSYKRVPVEETLVNDVQTIVSNFFITVWYNDSIILDFEVYGGEKRFRVKHVEGFHAGMFMDQLDKFRKKKFGVES